VRLGHTERLSSLWHRRTFRPGTDGSDESAPSPCRRKGSARDRDFERRVARLLAADRSYSPIPTDLERTARDSAGLPGRAHGAAHPAPGRQGSPGRRQRPVQPQRTRRSAAYQVGEETFGPDGRQGVPTRSGPRVHQFVRMDPPNTPQPKGGHPPFSARSLAREMRARSMHASLRASTAPSVRRPHDFKQVRLHVFRSRFSAIYWGSPRRPRDGSQLGITHRENSSTRLRAGRDRCGRGLRGPAGLHRPLIERQRASARHRPRHRLMEARTPVSSPARKRKP